MLYVSPCVCVCVCVCGISTIRREPANMSSVVTTVYMGERKAFDMIAEDENALDTLSLTTFDQP